MTLGLVDSCDGKCDTNRENRVEGDADFDDADFDDEEVGARASSLYEINFEASGRFVLSPMLRHFGKLTSKVFFHGTDTKFLMWDPDIFLSQGPEKFRAAKEELEYWLSAGGKGAK